MGQYGNQPDFGTIAIKVDPTGNPTELDYTYNFNPGALYIGTGGTLVCRVIGGNAYYDDPENPQSGYTIFYDVPDGTFFPVIVDWVFSGDRVEDPILTTCANIIVLR